MRCREHHYYITIPGKDRALLMESEISLANVKEHATLSAGAHVDHEVEV
jgi:hypothetical protein